MSQITTQETIITLNYPQEYTVTMNGITGKLYTREVKGQKYVLFAINEDECYGLNFKDAHRFLLVKVSKKGRNIKDSLPYSCIEFHKSFWESWLGIE